METPSDHLPREIDAASAGTVGEKAVIADADQSRGQHMQQEAAQELVDIEGQKLLGVAVCVVAIAEADTLAIERDDAGVADGDAVSVVGEIREHLLRSAERRFAVDDPVGSSGPCQEQVEGERVGEHMFGQLERSLTPCGAKRADQQTPETTREHRYRQEERGLSN